MSLKYMNLKPQLVILNLLNSIKYKTLITTLSLMYLSSYPFKKTKKDLMFI